MKYTPQLTANTMLKFLLILFISFCLIAAVLFFLFLTRILCQNSSGSGLLYTCSRFGKRSKYYSTNLPNSYGAFFLKRDQRLNKRQLDFEWLVQPRIILLDKRAKVGGSGGGVPKVYH